MTVTHLRDNGRPAKKKRGPYQRTRGTAHLHVSTVELWACMKTCICLLDFHFSRVQRGSVQGLRLTRSKESVSLSRFSKSHVQFDGTRGTLYVWYAPRLHENTLQ